MDSKHAISVVVKRHFDLMESVKKGKLTEEEKEKALKNLKTNLYKYLKFNCLVKGTYEIS